MDGVFSDGGGSAAVDPGDGAEGRTVGIGRDVEFVASDQMIEAGEIDRYFGASEIVDAVLGSGRGGGVGDAEFVFVEEAGFGGAIDKLGSCGRRQYIDSNGGGSGFAGRLVFCVGLEHEGCRTTGNAVDGDGAIGGGFGGDGDQPIATGDARLHIVVGIGGGDGIGEVEVEAGADREFCGRGDDGSRIGITAEGDVEGSGIGEGDAVVAEGGHLEGGLFVVGDEGVVGDGGAVVGRGEGDARDSGREGPRELGFVVGVEVAGLSGIATAGPLTRGAVGVGSGDIVVVITEGVVEACRLQKEERNEGGLSRGG